MKVVTSILWKRLKAGGGEGEHQHVVTCILKGDIAGHKQWLWVNVVCFEQSRVVGKYSKVLQANDIVTKGLVGVVEVGQ
jgi:hypothetical protein